MECSFLNLFNETGTIFWIAGKRAIFSKYCLKLVLFCGFFPLLLASENSHADLLVTKFDPLVSRSRQRFVWTNSCWNEAAGRKCSSQSLADGTHRPQKRTSVLWCGRVDSKPLTGRLFKPLPRRFSLLPSALVHAAPTPACLPDSYTNQPRAPSRIRLPPIRPARFPLLSLLWRSSSRCGGFWRWHRRGRGTGNPSPRCRRRSTRCRWATGRASSSASRRGSTGSLSTSPRPRTSSPSRGPRPRPPSCHGTTPPRASGTRRYAAASAPFSACLRPARRNARQACVHVLRSLWLVGPKDRILAELINVNLS